MEYDWVIGRFNGNQAKNVLAHASMGAGYLVLDTVGAGHGQTVVAAFRRPCDSPVPEHLELVSNSKKVDELEKRRKRMQGLDHAES